MTLHLARVTMADFHLRVALYCAAVANSHSQLFFFTQYFFDAEMHPIKQLQESVLSLTDQNKEMKERLMMEQVGARPLVERRDRGPRCYALPALSSYRVQAAVIAHATARVEATSNTL